MKIKYKLLGLSALILIATLIGLGYQFSFRYAQKQQQLQTQEPSAAVATPQSVSAQGEAETAPEEGFYLSHLHGFVVVYYADRQTIYEVTNIELSTLPAEVQNEIAEGKYMKDIGELYGFLENYSS